MITKNAIRCKHCGTVCVSKHRHDFAQCPCGKVAADGGHDYLRRMGTQGKDYEELSEHRQEVKPCPFCGMLPTIQEDAEQISIRCGCLLHPGITWPTAHKDEAIGRWNTRTGEAGRHWGRKEGKEKE